MKEVYGFLWISQLNQFIFLKGSSTVMWLGGKRWGQPTAECVGLPDGNTLMKCMRGMFGSLRDRGLCGVSAFWATTRLPFLCCYRSW